MKLLTNLIFIGFIGSSISGCYAYAGPPDTVTIRATSGSSWSSADGRHPSSCESAWWLPIAASIGTTGAAGSVR